MDLLTHAVAYARAGLAVLPLTPGGKTPLGSLVPHGKDDASSDVEQVRDWWVQCPTANIGLRPTLGVVVLDVDPRDGGASALVRLTRPHGGLSPTWTAWTGGGGLHAWYRVAGPYRKRLALGVDLKGHSGYVVAPPSLHASGRRYTWANELPVAVAPRWLAELMVQPARLLPSTVNAGVFTGASDDGLVRFVAQAAEGERNSVLWWAGWRAAQRGSLASLAPALRAAALGIGLGADEIERTLASAALAVTA